MLAHAARCFRLAPMRLFKSGIIFLVLALPALLSEQIVARQDADDPATIRTRLQAALGTLPWNPYPGYRLEGEFTFKGIPEEIRYQAVFVRLGDRRVADFSHEDATRNMRYGIEGARAWAASPEISTEVGPGLIPFTVQADFPQLFAELLRILDRGRAAPAFRLERSGRDIYVTGTLGSGQVATYLFNTVEYFPRKVVIRNPAAPASAWLFTTMDPDGSASFIRLPEPSSDYEFWFSNPVDTGSYRYPLRTDYAQDGEVVATFVMQRGSPIERADSLPERPEKLPWAGKLSYARPDPASTPSLFLERSEIPAFRARLSRMPWSNWRVTNGLAAGWALVAPLLGFVFFVPPGMKAVVLGVCFAAVGFALLAFRGYRLYGKRVSRGGLALFVLAIPFVLAAAAASDQMHSAGTRSLLALHASIRYTITGSQVMRWRSDRYLADLSDASASSLEELGDACQAYALAYDLIRPSLTRSRQERMEQRLFAYARPLYAGLQGWRSNTDAGEIAAAGLGMVGLAIGCEEYVKAATTTLERALKNRQSGGLPRSGPGPGALAQDAAANFYYALKKTGRADFFRHPEFRQYVRSTLQLMSPLGTLPLFGETGLDQSFGWLGLLMKVADQLPEDDGPQCLALAGRYWEYGRYSASGVRKLILHLLQQRAFICANPYVLFIFEKDLPDAAPPGSSAVLGNGQAAVLRSGVSPDSLYLGLSAAGWGWRASHRDILTFDMYARRGLLLHGAGHPGKTSRFYPASKETAASNCITLNGEKQSGLRCTGITSSMINQSRFDYVRALADKTYDYGQVQRDVVMVRPDRDHAGYFVLLDEVLTTGKEITVESYLHGRGSLVRGFDNVCRWKSVSFFSPRWGTDELTLAAFPLTSNEQLQSLSGRLNSQGLLQDPRSETLRIEWAGSRRLCTILFPLRSGAPEPRMQMLQVGKSAIVGDSDWISLSEPTTRRTVGPVTHVSEYVVARKHGTAFPSILMVFGLEFRCGLHSMASSKPVTVSLDGLGGGILVARPDTQIDFRSPEIKCGDRFLLDGNRISAAADGLLSFVIAAAGEHSLARED